MEPLPEIPTDKSLRDMYKHTLKHSRTGPFSSCIKDSIAALNFHHNQLKINYNADARNKLEFAIKELESLALKNAPELTGNLKQMVDEWKTSTADDEGANIRSARKSLFSSRPQGTPAAKKAKMGHNVDLLLGASLEQRKEELDEKEAELEKRKLELDKKEAELGPRHDTAPKCITNFIADVNKVLAKPWPRLYKDMAAQVVKLRDSTVKAALQAPTAKEFAAAIAKGVSDLAEFEKHFLAHEELYKKFIETRSKK